MAYAVLLRKIGTDGSQPDHWFADFCTGDTPTRRSQLIAQPPDPANWELVEIADDATYKSIEGIVYSAIRQVASATQQQADADWGNFKSKLMDFLTSRGFTLSEVQQFARRVLGQ